MALRSSTVGRSGAVLVTGGAGYIGSHACKALALAGYQPVVYDNLSNGHRQAVRWGPMVVGDVRDTDRLAETMTEHAVVGIIHFAGLIEVGRSVTRPDLFWDHNLNGVASVVAAMRRSATERLVFSSTAAVYGAPSTPRPLLETDALAPINPYGDTKLAAERLIAASCAAFGLRAIALRYFNACGADRDGEIGEAHHPETHLIPLAIEAALGGSKLQVYGADYPTRDGFCVRDYIHVSDLAQAHVLALQSCDAQAGFEAVNLGRGIGTSVREILTTVGRACGRTPEHIIGPRRAGDPPMLVANPARALARLNWRPRYMDTQGIIDTAVAWRRAGGFSVPSIVGQAA